jgi:diguanylate cyclase (GGDEF)-like protein
MRILLIEDDESIVYVLTIALVRQHYVLDVATDGEVGWDMIQSCNYDLVLLDVMLPKLDGIGLCRRLRDQGNSVPVILLTARDTTNDKLMGLDAGADDYVVKPFELEVLSARIRALLRRGDQAVMSLLTWGELTLNFNTREVHYQGSLIAFSRREYQILELFLHNPHRVFSRSAIVDQLWSFDEDPPTEDTVKSHVKTIRRKFKALGARNLVETLYGQGYRLNPAYQTPQATQTPSQEPASALEPEAKEPVQETQGSAQKAEEQLATELANIWERTKESTLNRIQDLASIVETLITGSFMPAHQEKAVHLAHKLTGSLGTFGFDQGSVWAKELETLFQTEFDPLILQREADPLVQNLQALLLTENLPQPSESQVFSASKKLLWGEMGRRSAQRCLLVVEPDQKFCQALESEANSWKIEVCTVSSPKMAEVMLQDHYPDAVLLNLDALQIGETDQEQFLKILADSKPSLPLLALSNQESLNNRLKAVQLKAQTILQKPTTATQVFSALVQTLEFMGPSLAKVIVVDDDPTILDLVQSLLKGKGLQTFKLQEPQRFWEVLKTAQPDLLILDIEMPEVDGLSLCQLVRNDYQWSWLPILFLTSHTDVHTLQRAFSAGADDFITKPIQPEQFVIRVMNRLQRTRLYRNQIEIDLLTGIANRHGGTRNFDQLLDLAIQSQQPLCLATLDLDHFKVVNDRYGHEVGDRVLHEFGEFLKRKCRSGDVLARWGGEEFIVGMLGLSRNKGVERISHILADWRSQSLKTLDGRSIQISFSAGIAQYPLDGLDFQVLYRTADAALYKAKAAGRNRVVPAI